MKVILLDYVYKHGVAGEVIDVADGFARNYLIPRGLATKATPGELKRAAKLREQSATKRAALEDTLNDLARLIDGVELIFGRRAAPTGKLFGSVTTQEIADALLEKTGADINRRRISQQALREIGTHEVPVRIGTETSPVLNVTIVREEELHEFLAKRAAEEEAARAAKDQAGSDDEVDSEGEPVDEEEAADADDLQTEILPASKVREMVEQVRKKEQEDAEAEAEPEPESEEEADAE